jgi:hypothetical protein
MFSKSVKTFKNPQDSTLLKVVNQLKANKDGLQILCRKIRYVLTQKIT